MRSILIAFVLLSLTGATYPCQQDDRHKKDIENDVKMGREYSEEVRKELPASENIAMIERVQTIGNRVASIANANLVEVTWGDKRLSPFTYEFTVVKGEDVNAFSLPGGFIYVYEGLVEFCESDDELAGVLAHEVAHASFRHVAVLRREQSKFDIVNIPLILAAIFSRSEGAASLAQGVGLLNQAVTSGWSVKAEESADYGAIQYLVGSEYNPVGILTFMERLALRDRAKPAIDWGIYQTHPPSSERAVALQRRLGAAGVPIKRSAVSTSLRADLRPNDDGKVSVYFGETFIFAFGGSDALVRADSTIAALNHFFDSVPALFELRIEEGTKVTGRDQPLLQATSEDGSDYQKHAKEAFVALKKRLFDMNYRLWPQSDRATIDR
ncbi:MAG: M48 family metalloprotease [Fimbriimonadaceae bacterium]